ncbi:MAG: CRISPR-associated endoribonuclease Cas6 [Ruminococcus sp.]|nr:CRISPR-associated endoribonuclease Cas6 [Ruminococcus sp.]
MKSIKLTLLPLQPLRLSYAHFKTLQGLAYSLIGHDQALASEIHDRSYPDQKAFKFFCFTDIIGRYQNNGEKLIYKNTITWELRSVDDRVINAVEQYVLENPTVKIGKQLCKIISYEMREKHFCTDTLTAGMNTPIVVYHTEVSGFVRYYHPFEQAFFDAVIKNIKNKYEMFYEKPLPGDVIFISKNPSDRDKCITHYEKTIITAWYGEYQITASPEVLDFIWYTGLGGKNSMGFGTILENNIR